MQEPSCVELRYLKRKGSTGEINPPLVPGELLYGYLCRGAEFNNGRRVIQRRTHDGRSFPTVVHAAAHHNQRTVLRVLFENTLFRVDGDSASNSFERLLEDLASSGSANSLVYCEACVRAHLEQYKFSYWLRDLQVPGRLVCPTHGTRLLRLDLRVAGGGPLSADSTGAQFAMEQEMFDQCVANRHVQVAIAVLDALMSNYVLDRSQWTTSLLGQFEDRFGDLDQINAIIWSTYPFAWLQHMSRKGVVGVLHSKGKRRSFDVLGSLVGAAMAAGALYPSTETARRAMGCKPLCLDSLTGPLGSIARSL